MDGEFREVKTCRKCHVSFLVIEETILSQPQPKPGGGQIAGVKRIKTFCSHCKADEDYEERFYR